MFRVYYKENTDWIEQTKDFNTFGEALDFLDKTWFNWYIVLLGKFRIWKHSKSQKN